MNESSLRNALLTVNENVSLETLEENLTPVRANEKDEHIANTQHLTNTAANVQREINGNDGMNPSDFSKVLVIYTGGTIGMKYSPKKGYRPAKNYLFNYLKSHPSFCDAAFQEQNPHEHLHEDDCISDPIITPSSIYGKRISFQLLEYLPLLDSSNMTMEQWVTIATDVEKYYHKFDAFIILHGTDTMAFTASALSFMLENLGKTVIITGSQIPISEMRNDGTENFLGALTVAGHYSIPEVCIYFNNKLFRGNRCSKVSAIDLEAFDSPNMKPLVTLNIQIEVDWNEVFHTHSIAPFKVHKRMNPNVATIRLFPGITEGAVRAFLKPPIDGVVIEAFGSGNLPDNRPELLEVFSEASSRGVVIINCTQCRKGRVSEIYATARRLTKIGIVFGSDMTPECALTKLSYCLGKYSAEETRSLMSQSLRGELTVIPKMHRFSIHQMPLTLENCGNEDKLLQQRRMNSAMCNAASINDVETMKNLVNGGYTVNCFDYSKRTPLHIAASMGNLEAVEFLLKNGANIHTRDGYDNLVLWDAVKHNHIEVANLLYAKGGRLNRGNVDTYHSFFKAIIKNNIELVEWYVYLGIDLKKTTIEGTSSIELAERHKNDKIVKILQSKF